MSKETGGPAFPVVQDCGMDDPEMNGMTLRDHFAGQALSSGQASNWRDNDYKPVNGLTIIQNTGLCAYAIADAMLEARKS